MFSLLGVNDTQSVIQIGDNLRQDFYVPGTYFYATLIRFGNIVKAALLLIFSPLVNRQQ